MKPDAKEIRKIIIDYIQKSADEKCARLIGCLLDDVIIPKTYQHMSLNAEQNEYVEYVKKWVQPMINGYLYDSQRTVSKTD